jgi:hypothetical protein
MRAARFVLTKAPTAIGKLSIFRLCGVVFREFCAKLADLLGRHRLRRLRQDG